jgi:hypothetical protein
MTNAQRKPADQPQELAAKARRRPTPKQRWARLQIEAAVDGLRQEGVPLDLLSVPRIAERCKEWLRDFKKVKPNELPSTSSCLKHLPEILKRVPRAAA